MICIVMLMATLCSNRYLPWQWLHQPVQQHASDLCDSLIHLAVFNSHYLRIASEYIASLLWSPPFRDATSSWPYTSYDAYVSVWLGIELEFCDLLLLHVNIVPWWRTVWLGAVVVLLFLIHPCHAVGSMPHDSAGPVSGLNEYDWFVHCWFYFDSLALDWIGCFKEAITRIRLTRFMIWYNSSNAMASDGDRTGSKHFIYSAYPLVEVLLLFVAWPLADSLCFFL